MTRPPTPRTRLLGVAATLSAAGLVTVAAAPALAAAAPASYAAALPVVTSSGTHVVDSQSVQVDADPSGHVDNAYLFTQLAVTGHGAVTVDAPTATSGLRDLDGFSAPSVSNGHAVWHLDVDGSARRRTVATFPTAKLPVTVSASYTLDGAPIAAKDVVGRSGVLRATFMVRNTTSVQQQVRYRNGAGRLVTSTLSVPTPMVGQLQTILPAGFQQISAPNASLAGDGHGATITSYQMVLLPPMGNVTQKLTYQATLSDATLPAVQVLVVPVAPKTVPSLRWAEQSIASGAATSRQISSGGSQLDDGLVKLATGTGKLMTGLGKLSSGATQLHSGLSTAGSGTQQLAAGTTKLSAGTDQLSSGLKKLAAGERKALAGQKSALAGASIGLAGLSGNGAVLRSSADKLVGQLQKLTTRAQALQKSGDSGAASLASGLQAVLSAAKTVAATSTSSQQAASGLSALLLPGLTKLVAGQSQLSTGAGAASAGAAKIATGAGQLDTGGHQLADGLPAAVSGSGQIATGLGKAGTGSDKIKAGLGQAKSKGTSALIKGGNASAAVYGQQAAVLQAMDVKAQTSATPYPAPAGSTSNAAYSFGLAAATRSATNNTVRGLVAIALLAGTSLVAWAARRRSVG